MSAIRRRDPRRSFQVTPTGIRRIGLDASSGPAALPSHSDPFKLDSTVTPPKPFRTNHAAVRCLLAIVQSEQGALDEHARQVIVAAALLSDEHAEVIAAILGELTEDAAAFGADRVIVLSDCDSRQFRPEHVASRLAALLQRHRPTRVLLPERSGGEGDVGRRLAAAHDLSIATHVVEIDNERVAARFGASRRLARRALTDIVLLSPDAVDARLPFVGRGVQGDAGVDRQSTSVYVDRGLYSLDAASVPLEEARVVAAAGNGVLDVALFNRLARALNASVGASRVAVDDGRFARDRQIGATGKTIAANVYVAIGISGAVQHLQGIKDCRHVIAVNRDVAAPIMKRADLAVSDDAQSFMTALLAALDAAKQGQERVA
jgi:electron transfer flavoprotein alpha subunit